MNWAIRAILAGVLGLAVFEAQRARLRSAREKGTRWPFRRALGLRPSCACPLRAVRRMHPFGASGLWLAAAISAATTILVGLGQRIDLAKKVLETYKVWRDVKTVREAEEEKSRLVRIANVDEIKLFGQSPVERILKERYQKTGQLCVGA